MRRSQLKKVLPMIDKRFRFGICSDNTSLVDRVKKFAAAKDIDLDVSLNSLEEAIPEAKRMEAAGVEIILTGISTAIFLKEVINIPVVDFRFDVFDVISNFVKAAEQAKKIIVPIPAELPGVQQILSKQFGVQIDQVVYHDIVSARIVLEKAKEQGFEMVVGSGYLARCAKELGLLSITYEWSDNTILDTIKKAVIIARSGREIREKSNRYRTILDSSPDGVIAVDGKSRITAINKTACEYLNLKEHEVIQQPIDTIIPKSSIKESLKNNTSIADSIEKIKNKTFVWNHQPFYVFGELAGCVSTFKEISSVMRSENKIRRTLSKGHVARYTINNLLYQSDAMEKTISDARRYAGTDSNLLITGETGTGKEVLVQSIHNLSARKDFPFVSINCAAMPEQLLESELFGYEEGAFTGSRKGGKPGLFELAHKGTIFLDEIGETFENLQTRLLRVLQEREIMRLGDDRLISIDVRVIAASNKDLTEEVRKKNFRSDLFFRLNILRIHIPPLRSRLADISILFELFMQNYSKENGLNPFTIPPTFIEQMKTYPWPGNVRQLQNFTERLVLLSNSRFDRLVFEDLFGQLLETHSELDTSPEILKNDAIQRYISETEDHDTKYKGETLKERIDQFTYDRETDILKKALEETKYSKTKAAKMLGISRSTLWRKLKKAGLE